MIELAEQHISIYLDVMSLVTMIGFMIISNRLRMRNNTGDRLFFIICCNVIAFSFLNLIKHIIPGSGIIFGKEILTILGTFLELIEILVTYQWILFVGYWLYESTDHLKRRYWGLAVPLVLIVLMYFINLFTGFMFWYGDDLNLRLRWPFLLVEMVQFIYLVISGVLIWKNNRNTSGMNKFHFAPVLLPFIISFILSGITAIDASSMGFAIGAIFIFISMTERWQYDSGIKGFYHRAFVNYMKEQAKAGKEDYYSAIVFNTSGDELVLADIIREVVPKTVKPVHLSEGSFGVFLGKGKEDLIDMITASLTEAVGEYDLEHQNAPVALKVDVRDRRADESIDDFLRY